jgi:hypothetical protein
LVVGHDRLELSANGLRVGDSDPQIDAAAENKADRSDAMSPDRTARGSIVHSPPIQSTGEPSTADLERAIVAAMLDGRGAVAEILAERLKERRHARAGNVVALSRDSGGRGKR